MGAHLLSGRLFPPIFSNAPRRWLIPCASPKIKSAFEINNIKKGM